MRKFTHMARVISEYTCTGRFDDVQLYEMDGQVYTRMVSTLEGKKVKKHPAFARTRIEYKRLALASPIAKAVYRQLPEAVKVRGYFQAMTGVVINLLRQGITKKEAYDILYEAATAQRCMDTRPLPERAYYIAAAIYKQLPAQLQLIGYFEALMDQAIQLLREDYTITEVYDLLYQAAMPQQKKTRVKHTGTPAITFAEELLDKLFTCSLEEPAIRQYCMVESMPP